MSGVLDDLVILRNLVRYDEAGWDGGEAMDRVEVEIARLQRVEAAAMRLCNLHRWSYGGPETLEALAQHLERS